MLKKNILFLLPIISLLIDQPLVHPFSSSDPNTVLSFKKNELFDSDKVLEITLSGQIKEVLNDRAGEPKDFQASLSYTSQEGELVSIPIVLSTRGHFRRIKANCTYPPLLIRFLDKGKKENTLFEKQKKLKLVMPCRGDDYIVREWLAYRAYQFVTPYSFKARLVKVSLMDSRSNKAPTPFFGILLEEEDQVAQRNNMISVEKKLHPTQTQVPHFLKVAVFQYLIGNTDWSVQYLQNIKLLAKDSTATPIVVPYDFDHAGIISAPYAKPAPELKLNSVKERRYRGYCENNLKLYEAVIDTFKNLKTSFYELYKNDPYIDEKYSKATLKFLDEFYEVLDDPKAWKKEFLYPCDKNGTGNVVIKGLRKD